MWYIVIEGKTEGPFSFLDLRKDSRLTPDTFVWREGFDKWKRIREVPELSSLFEDEGSHASENDALTKPKGHVDEEIVLDTRMQPPYFVWFLIALFILLYFLFQLLGNS